MSCWRQAVTTVATAALDSLCGGVVGWGGGLGVMIESNLNRVRLSCWVGVGLCCYNTNKILFSSKLVQLSLSCIFPPFSFYWHRPEI